MAEQYLASPGTSSHLRWAQRALAEWLCPSHPQAGQLRPARCFQRKDLKGHFMTASVPKPYSQNIHGQWHIQNRSDYLIKHRWPQMIFSLEIFASILSGRADPVLEQEGRPESIPKSLQALFSCGLCSE